MFGDIDAECLLDVTISQTISKIYFSSFMFIISTLFVYLFDLLLAASLTKQRHLRLGLPSTRMLYFECDSTCVLSMYTNKCSNYSLTVNIVS